MSKYDDLVKKLKEIFQIDRPELDFGIYRIFNTRAEEINHYLENRLKAKVSESLATSGEASVSGLRRELEEKKSQYQADGVDPDTVPKIQEIKQKLVQYSVNTSEHENAVFSHLLTFFSRYYDKGDFISQRRYKGDTYAIPYAGEEVVLHWANKDQYYIKSSENFSNYAFKLDDGRVVRFRLVTADTAKDNRKDNDKERRFVLVEKRTCMLIDDEGDEYEEELLPVAEENGELVLRFEYKAMSKGSKQDALVLDAASKVLNDTIVKTRWLDLSKREPTEKNPQRTCLEKHLTQYTARNTADYFIHKDLGRFLRNELDFYIKNEVMHLDDVQHAEKFADIEKNLRLIQTLRAIALDLVDFLAQLEDFQKKLWLKKKFVVDTQYCITLDRVPESLYPIIAANPQQWEQWEKLGMLDSDKADLFAQAEAKSIEYLKEHPYLMADTALFDAAFKYALLAAVDNLDDSLDGLLIHGDNFQALNLLQERYRERVKCIHIDPPYNTASSGFLYKNAYPHSSWLSLIQDRLKVSISLLADLGIFACHIDEFEMERLHLLLEATALDNAGTMVWDKGMPIAGANGLATQHEYVIFRTKGKAAVRVKKKNINAIHSKINELYVVYGAANKDAIKEYRKWLKAQTYLTKSEMTYDQFDDTKKAFRSDNMSATDRRTNEKFYIPLKHPRTNKDCPVPEYGWRYTPDSLSNLNADELVLFGEDESTMPRKKTYLENTTDSQMSTIFRSGSRGKIILDSLGFEFPFAHSVDFYNYIIDASVNSNDLILDFFAGSGTTGHAVITLNRQDNGHRKYILVEQGEYFYTVTKPRIQKVVYSANWKNGKATAPETGISHAFKVLKLESYEDTLNNLQLHRTT